jgi:hypothetical protein
MVSTYAAPGDDRHDEGRMTHPIAELAAIISIGHRPLACLAWLSCGMLACVAFFGTSGAVAQSPDDPRWADLGRACAADAPAPSLSEASRDSIPAVSWLREEGWAEVARRTPGGWGGYFLDDGRPTMYLKDPSQRDAALASLASQGISLGNAVVLQGRWDFAQLNDWYRYLFQHMSLVESLSMTDIQEAANRLEYGVTSETARRQMEEILAALEVPCFLVAIGIRGPARSG